MWRCGRRAQGGCEAYRQRSAAGQPSETFWISTSNFAAASMPVQVPPECARWASLPARRAAGGSVSFTVRPSCDLAVAVALLPIILPLSLILPPSPASSRQEPHAPHRLSKTRPGSPRRGLAGALAPGTAAGCSSRSRSRSHTTLNTKRCSAGPSAACGALGVPGEVDVRLRGMPGVRGSSQGGSPASRQLAPSPSLAPCRSKTSIRALLGSCS